ncbi:hypothetical protein TCON_1361 [Astathelohania contejeani]|uniref:Uncharacterized protein n=1 Tax=Astathelohania contejeani TaxID=164912 RepID=A0ABQ7HZ36_9MICR|nr:hypothetical protein TCON_1361 [Thelohania contejeani]
MFLTNISDSSYTDAISSHIPQYVNPKFSKSEAVSAIVADANIKPANNSPKTMKVKVDMVDTRSLDWDRYKSINAEIPEMNKFNFELLNFDILVDKLQLSFNKNSISLNKINTCIFDPVKEYKNLLNLEKKINPFNYSVNNLAIHDDLKMANYWIRHKSNIIDKTTLKITIGIDYFENILNDIIAMRQLQADYIHNIEKYVLDNDSNFITFNSAAMNNGIDKPIIDFKSSIGIINKKITNISKKINHIFRSVKINEHIIKESMQFLKKDDSDNLKNKKIKSLIRIINLINISVDNSVECIKNFKFVILHLSETASLIEYLFNDLYQYNMLVPCSKGCKNENFPDLIPFSDFVNKLSSLLSTIHDNFNIKITENKKMCFNEKKLCLNSDINYFKSIEFITNKGKEMAEKYLELCENIRNLKNYKNTANITYTYYYFIFKKIVYFQHIKITKSLLKTPIEIDIINEFEVDFSKVLKEEDFLEVKDLILDYLKHIS